MEEQAYSQLLSEAIDLAIPDMLADQRVGAVAVVVGALLLAAGGSMLARRVALLMSPQDGGDGDTALSWLSKVDVVLLLGMFVALVVRLLRGPVPEILPGILFSAALAVASVVLLVKRMRLCVVPMVLFWWLFLLPDQLQAVGAALSDAASIGSFSSAGKVGVFSAYSAILQRAASVVVVLACLTVLIVYRQARLGPLFDADGADAAEKGSGDEGQQTIGEQVKGGVAEIVRVVLLTLLATVLVAPNLVGGVADRVVPVVSGPRDAYARLLADAAGDGSLLRDEAWVEGFRDASAEMIRADDRCFQIRADAVATWEVPFFAAFAEANFDQMQAVEKAWDAVKGVGGSADADTPDTPDMAGLAEGFDRTVLAQDEARLALYANSVYANGVVHGIWEQMCYSIRAFQLLAGQVVFGVALAVVGIACGAVSIILARRAARVASGSSATSAPAVALSPEPAETTVSSPSTAGEQVAAAVSQQTIPETAASVPPKDAAAPPVSEQGEPGAGAFAAKRNRVVDRAVETISAWFTSLSERTQRAMVIAVAVLLVVVGVAIQVVPDIIDRRETEARVDCIQAMASVTQGRVDAIDGLLLAAQLGRVDLADPGQRAVLLEAVDAQLRSVAKLEAIDPLPDEFADIEGQVRELCAYQRGLLEEIRASVEAGQVPADETVAALASLPGERFSQLYSDIATQAIVGVFSNL